MSQANDVLQNADLVRLGARRVQVDSLWEPEAFETR
jgi:hypothetical protein